MSASSDKARLAALRRFLVADAKREDNLARTARLAAQLFGVPYAMVALIDQKDTSQRTVDGAYGLDDAMKAHGDLLAAAVEGEKVPLVVTDATQDDRFGPLAYVVEKPHVKFFASAPLKNADGFTVGTLRMMDTVPRELNGEGMQLLGDLAALAEWELELRQQTEKAKKKAADAEKRAAEAEAEWEKAEAALAEAGTAAPAGPAPADPALEADLAAARAALESAQAELAEAREASGDAPASGSAIRRAAARAARLFLRESDWHPAGQDLLAALAEATGASHAALYLNRRADGSLVAERVLSAPAPTDASAPVDFEEAGLSDWPDGLGKGAAIDAAAEGNALAADGTARIAALPMDVAGRWGGFLLLQWPEADARPEDELAALNVAADVFGAVMDRERIQVQESAAAQTSSMEATLLETGPAALLALRPDGTVTYATPAAASLLGFESAAAATGVALSRQATSSHRDKLTARLAKAMVAGPEGAAPFVGTFKGADGERRLEVRFVRATVEGRPAVQALLTDLTDAASKQETLARQLKAAQAELARQRAVLGQVASELRTPVTSILGFSEVLTQEAGPELAGLVGLVHENSRRLSGAVGSLLEFVELENGRTIERRPMDAREAVETAAEAFRAQAEAQGLTFDVDVADAPLRIYGEAAPLQRAVEALVSNAVQFTEQGSIEVKATQQDGRIAIEVKDTGVGVGDAFRSQLFEPFQREDQDAGGGIGLGLAIAHRLVERMGGAIGVESHRGQGSTFRITFPAAGRSPEPDTSAAYGDGLSTSFEAFGFDDD